MMTVGRIKIAYVIGQLAVGGTENQLLALLKNLDPRRFEPYVIYLSEQQSILREKFHYLKIPVYVLDRDQNGRILTLWNLYRLLRTISPDIVHTFSFASRATIPVAKLMANSRIVVSFRTDPKRWVKFLDRLLINSADLLMENSVAAVQSYQFLNKSLKTPPSEVVHNGVDLSLFDNAMLNEIIPSIPYFPQHNPPVICVIAGLRPAKHLSLLLEAYALLRLSFPNVRLWFVGDGEERSKLEKIASVLDIASYVVFWGARTDVPAILAKAYMGVLSSQIEGMPNAILEYMAARLPVIATNVGGNGEAVVHGQTGLLIPFGDPKALADAMLYFLQNPDIARQFGKAGRHRVEENFTIERMVYKTELVYQNLITSGKC